MRTLYLSVKKKYFDQIKANTKKEEFRVIKPYWIKRLQGVDYDFIEIMCGYPKKGDTSKRINRPYKGYVKKIVEHPEWNNKPTPVFAIFL